MPELKRLLRRIAAAGYDGLVLLAIWIVATGLLMPFTGGAIDPPLPWNIPFDLYILGVSFAYFGWFWTHGGQTIGMKTWKFEVVDLEGRRINSRAALLRFLLAIVSWLPLGAGWLWMLFDRDGITLHERFSDTRVRRVAED